MKKLVVRKTTILFDNFSLFTEINCPRRLFKKMALCKEKSVLIKSMKLLFFLAQYDCVPAKKYDSRVWN
jgi:hypothetical protein